MFFTKWHQAAVLLKYAYNTDKNKAVLWYGDCVQIQEMLIFSLNTSRDWIEVPVMKLYLQSFSMKASENKIQFWHQNMDGNKLSNCSVIICL